MALPQWNPYGQYGNGNNGQVKTGVFLNSGYQVPAGAKQQVFYGNSGYQIPAGAKQGVFYGGGLSQQQPQQPTYGSGLGPNGDFWSQVGNLYSQAKGGLKGNINLTGNLPAMDPQGFNHLLDYTGGSIWGANYNGTVSPDQMQEVQQRLDAAKANGFRGSIPSMPAAVAPGAPSGAVTTNLGTMNVTRPAYPTFHPAQQQGLSPTLGTISGQGFY